MNNVTRWNPFQDLQNLHSQFNRVFEPYRRNEQSILSGACVPPVDVEETADKLYVRAEVSGMKQEDLDIQFENGVLTIRGERKFENESNERNFHRIERSYGTFARSFTLPATINVEKVTARYENGVLELEMPKREEAKPRRISISGKQIKPASEK